VLRPEVLAALSEYSWPGNVRELENVLSRAATLCEGEAITLDLLPAKLQSLAPAPSGTEAPETPSPAVAAGTTLRAFLREKERAYLKQALEQHGGSKEAAARALGISLATFYRKYDEDYGVSRHI
jgi:two-component system response regulator HydG